MMKNEYPKMNKVIKRQWLKALRSGEYEQGQGALCEEDDDGNCKFCCLGVLYDATQDAWWEKKPGRSAWMAREFYGYNHSIFGHDVIGNSAVNDLVIMNDAGKSFKQIANWIEKNL